MGSSALVRATAALAVFATITAVWVGSTLATNAAGITGSTSCTGLNMMEITNSSFTYNRDTLDPAMRDAVIVNARDNITPTDFAVFVHSPAQSVTDVVYFDQNYTNFCNYMWHGSGGNVIGLTKCHALGSGSACEKHNVYFDLSWVNAGGVGSTNELALACHETGHTMSISHTTGSTCLASNSVTYYSAHEINDIINFNW